MSNNIWYASPVLPLQESTGEAWGDWIDPRQQMWDTPDFGFAPGYFAQPSRIEDRADGNFLPYYQTEQELAQMRGVSRAVVASGPVAIGVVNTLKNYVVGKGFTFCIQPKENQEPPEELVDLVQSVLSDLMEMNNFVNDLDKEIYGRAIEDGESVVTVERGEAGIAQFLIHEPDALTGPISPQVIDDYAYQQFGITAAGIPSFSYGVHTDRRRPDLPLGYHIVWGSGGQDWDYYPAFRVEHFKRNVSRNAKRGVSDYYQVWPWLLRSDKLHKNTIEGESVRQAIAYVQQFPTGTQKTQAQAASGMVTDGTRTVQGPSGPGIIKTRKHVPGSVVGLSPGLEYKDGPGSGSSSKAEGAILIGNGILRMSGVRWSMPEYMITGDASNANLASSLTAESPFVKACEAEQEALAEQFECLLWKGLRYGFEFGLFNKFGLKWEEIRKLLKIKVDPPSVATRDMLKLAQTHEIQLRNKTICRETAISEEGHDPKEEMPRIEEEAQEAQERALQFQQQGLGPDGKPLPVQSKPPAGLLTGPNDGEDDSEDKGDPVPDSLKKTMESIVSDEIKKGISSMWESYP